jgi:NAD(P)-dependent dehydrogenase (short-subunit alcohol dehydrogenase family)
MRRAVDVFTLAPKTAFVTGGASGIGAAIAHAFVRAGARVIIADRDAAQGPAVAANLGARFVHLDVASETEFTRIAAEVGSACTRVASNFTKQFSQRPRSKSGLALVGAAPTARRQASSLPRSAATRAGSAAARSVCSPGSFARL